MLYLLLLVSIVVCSPIPPLATPSVSLHDDSGLKQGTTATLHASSYPSGISLNQENAHSLETTPSLSLSSGGGSGPLPEVHVTSEVRTVTLQIAEGGVHVMKHVVNPMVFGKQSASDDIFLEPTEVEAPDATPTSSSLVTSVSSRILLVSPLPALESKPGSRAESPSELTKDYSSKVNGSPENITVLDQFDGHIEVIPIIKVNQTIKTDVRTGKRIAGFEEDGNIVALNGEMKTEIMPQKSVETVENYNKDIIADVNRNKRIFPSVLELDTAAGQKQQTDQTDLFLSNRTQISQVLEVNKGTTSELRDNETSFEYPDAKHVQTNAQLIQNKQLPRLIAIADDIEEDDSQVDIIMKSQLNVQSTHISEMQKNSSTKGNGEKVSGHVAASMETPKNIHSANKSNFNPEASRELALGSMEKPSQRNSSFPFYFESLQPSDLTEKTSKVEPREANAASYYKSRDEMDALSDADFPSINIDTNIKPTNENTDTETGVHSIEKYSPETDNTDIARSVVGEISSLSGLPVNGSPMETPGDVPVEGTNNKFGSQFRGGEEESGRIMAGGVDILDATSFRSQIPGVLLNSQEDFLIKSASIQSENSSNEKSNDLTRKSIGGFSPFLYSNRSIHNTNSSLPTSEHIVEHIPPGNAHLIPGSLNSRVLEPILDSYIPDPSNNPPQPQEQISAPVSEQIGTQMAPGCVAAIVMGVLLCICAAVGAFGFIVYQRQTGIRPKVLSSDRSSANSDSGGYFDDQCRVAYVNSQLDVPKGTPEDLVSLDNDSFLNSLESMTIQNLWTDSIRHTKL